MLHATLYDGTEVHGQSSVAKTRWIERVWISPDDIRPSADALRAIAEADVIVIGPGSLFTSILPGLLIPEVREAVLASPALRVYVCNVATQQGETEGFDLADHVEALERHTAPGLADIVLANSEPLVKPIPGSPVEPVRLRWPPTSRPGAQLVLEDVVDRAQSASPRPGPARGRAHEGRRPCRNRPATRGGRAQRVIRLQTVGGRRPGAGGRRQVAGGRQR